MILTRIKRGAIRSKILMHNKISQFRKPTLRSLTRSMRNVGLTILSTYTAVMPVPVHASTQPLALSTDTEPPSTVQVTAPLSLTEVTSQTIVDVALADVHSGESLAAAQARIQAENEAKQRAEEARRQAEEEAAQAAQKAAAEARVLAAAPVQVVSYAVSADKTSVLQSIERHAAENGVSAQTLTRVANCESGFNPGAVNYGYSAGYNNHPSGVFQFLPTTFYANARAMGLANADLWNPDQQAQVAAYMFAHGQSYQWQCK